MDKNVLKITTLPSFSDKELVKEVLRVEKKFLSQCDNLSLWSLMGEEGDISAYHRSEDGFLSVMGKGAVYYCPRWIWKTILDPAKRREW